MAQGWRASDLSSAKALRMSEAATEAMAAAAVEAEAEGAMAAVTVVAAVGTAVGGDWWQGRALRQRRAARHHYHRR